MIFFYIQIEKVLRFGTRYTTYVIHLKANTKYLCNGAAMLYLYFDPGTVPAMTHDYLYGMKDQLFQKSATIP